MQGYILDVNHIEALFRQDPKITAKIRTIPAERLLYVCSIALGEIEAGHQMTQTTDQARRDEYINFVYEKFSDFTLSIEDSTKKYYAKIIGGIWQNNPPKNSKKKTERHLLDLGVDINDVWAVAVAWNHGLTFVTKDEMKCIKAVSEPYVIFDDWLKN